eukprot:scaffold278418_cov53-Attheya_sp.AAC.5
MGHGVTHARGGGRCHRGRLLFAGWKERRPRSALVTMAHSQESPPIAEHTAGTGRVLVDRNQTRCTVYVDTLELESRNV